MEGSVSSDEKWAEVVRLVAAICEVPVARIVVTDALGADPFSAHVVASPKDGVLVVGDARTDARFAESVLVTGEDRVVFYAGAPIVAANGKAVGALAVFDTKPRSLTVVQRQTLATLANVIARDVRQKTSPTEAAWRETVDALPLLVSFVAADATYGLVNRSYEDWFGIRGEDMVGRRVRDVIGEPAWAVLGPNVERGLAGERFDFEQYGVPYRLGGKRDIRVSFIPHFDLDGSPNGYTALLEDITSRRRLEQERALLSKQRNEVLESIGDAFMALDTDWRIYLVNRELEELVGIPRTQLEGLVFWDVFGRILAEYADAEALLRHAMASRERHAFTIYSRLRRRWLEIRAFAATDGGLLLFLRDVTAEKNAEVLAQRQVAFERQLIGIVSHDLRNPLNVISMSSHLLRRNDDLNAVAAKHVVRIQNACDRSNRLIIDLLDFTKARLGGGLELVRAPGDLHTIARSVLEEIEATHPDRTIDYRAEGDGSGEYDGGRIGQLVQNLVTNALKYSDGGSAVSVVTRGEGDHVVLIVHNEGHAISAQQREAIFEPFERGPNLDDAATRSVGLGLYIVKQVVDAHGGMIDVQSLEVEGTTFRATLPRRPSAPT